MSRQDDFRHICPTLYIYMHQWLLEVHIVYEEWPVEGKAGKSKKCSVVNMRSQHLGS